MSERVPCGLYRPHPIRGGGDGYHVCLCGYSRRNHPTERLPAINGACHEVKCDRAAGFMWSLACLRCGRMPVEHPCLPEERPGGQTMSAAENLGYRLADL